MENELPNIVGDWAEIQVRIGSLFIDSLDVATLYV